MTTKFSPFNGSGYEADVGHSLFSFERNFDHGPFLTWINRYWTLSIVASGIYVVAVFALRRYMAGRVAYRLRAALTVWSGLLAAFSVAGAARTVPEVIYVLRRHGWQYSVCNPSFYYGPTAFWTMAFTVSKAFELFDTVFVVLRKQPLVFLHWYHHVTVLVYVWYSHTDFTAPGRWFMTLNYVVHSFMYSYYAVRASGLGRLLPPAISIFITTLQIIQMGVGLVVTGSAYRLKSALGGEDCHQSYDNMFYCAAMYASYLVLFVHFFWGKYVRQASSSSSPRLVVNGKRETAAHYHKSD